MSAVLESYFDVPKVAFLAYNVRIFSVNRVYVNARELMVEIYFVA